MSELKENGIQRMMRVAEELSAQLAAEKKRADAIQKAYDHDTTKLQQEIQRLTAANGGLYWRWQGKGVYLDSLTCPILIDVNQLHEIFSVNMDACSRATAAEQARDEAVREVERLRAENAWLRLWHEEARKELELLLSRTLTKEATCPAS